MYNYISLNIVNIYCTKFIYIYKIFLCVKNARERIYINFINSRLSAFTASERSQEELISFRKRLAFLLYFSLTS